MLGWRQGLSQYLGARGQPGARGQEPGAGRQETGARGQTPENRSQGTGNRSQGTGARSQEPGTGARGQGTRCHLLQSAMSVQGKGLFTYDVNQKLVFADPPPPIVNQNLK